MPDRLIFKPVTKARWGDFDALFEAPGGPKYCWCMAWRTTPAEARETRGAERKPLMQQRIVGGMTVGVLGYLGDEPVAWVSVAPRDTYRDLGGPDAKPGEIIWSLACMYLKRADATAGPGRRVDRGGRCLCPERRRHRTRGLPGRSSLPKLSFHGIYSGLRACRLHRDRHRRHPPPNHAVNHLVTAEGKSGSNRCNLACRLRRCCHGPGKTVPKRNRRPGPAQGRAYHGR